MGKYTIHGSQEFEDKIDACLNLVVQRFTKVVDPNSIHALILGGGYGRGEGGVLTTDEGEELYNDLDLFVISKDFNLLKIKQMNKLLHDLHKELTREIGVDVDFSRVLQIRLVPKTPFILMWYDLKYAHQVLLGKKDILKYLPDWQQDEVPFIEGLKLMLNRGMGLYFAREFLDRGLYEQERDFIVRNLHKAYQAIGDAILIAEHRYHWSAVAKLERMKSIALEQYCKDVSLLHRYDLSMKFKFEPSFCSWSEDECRAEMATTTRIFKEVYYALWATFGNYDGCDLASHLNYLKYSWREDNTLRNLAKNALLNFIDTKGRSFSFEIFLRYPRYRLFFTFPWLLFKEDYDPKVLSHALGMPMDSAQATISERFIELWEKYN